VGSGVSGPPTAGAETCRHSKNGPTLPKHGTLVQEGLWCSCIGRRRSRMMQLGLSHGSKGTIRFLRKVTAEAAEKFIGKDQAYTIDPNTLT
jgi:hypothetical protein